MRIGRWLLLAVAASILACSDEDLPLPPKSTDPQGRVEGKVRVAGEAAQALVRIAGGRESGYRRVDVRTDSEGNYSVPLPEGTYRLWVDSSYGDFWYSATGSVADGDDADTLRVVAGGPPVRADLDLGAIELHLRLPEWWDGRYFGVAVWACPDSSNEDLDRLGSEYFYDYPESIVVRLGPVLAGSYLLSVVASEVPADLWLPGNFRRADADTIVVTSEAAASYSCSLAVQRRIIRGSITGAWETLIEGAPSVLACVDDQVVAGYTSAARDGSFALPVVAANWVRIRMDIGSTTRWLGGDSFDHATLIELPDTGAVDLPPIADRGVRVRLDTSQMQGSGSAECGLYEVSGRLASYNWISVPGEDVGICGLIPGAYRLQILPHHFGAVNLLSQWYDRASSPEQATLIHIGEEDMIVPITATLEPGGVVRGRVSTPDDWWSSVTFVVTDAARDTCLQYSYVELSTDRSFEILGFPDGAYKLAFGGYGFECGEPLPAGWIWYGQTADWDSAAVITISDHGTVEGIDVELPEFGGDGIGRPTP